MAVADEGAGELLPEVRLVGAAVEADARPLAELRVLVGAGAVLGDPRVSLEAGAAGRIISGSSSSWLSRESGVSP